MSDGFKTKPVFLQILPALESGGVERGTVDLALYAAKHGYTSMVASSGGTLVKRLDAHGVKHFKLPLHSKNPLTMAINSIRLASIIKKQGVNIVHARSRAPAWSAERAAKTTGAHFITTFHGTYGISGPLKQSYNSVMTRGERVIAISEFIAAHLKEEYDVPEERIRVIHRGVDLDTFSPEAVERERLLAMQAQWKPQKYLPVIFLPGRFTRWKGHDFLLDALAEIPHHDYTCVMAGDDKKHKEYRKELLEKIELLQFRGHVSLFTHVDDMSAAYLLSDIVVSSSIEPEAFGRVAAEAQAMGKIIIATDHGGAKETVIPGKTGWLVPPGDAKALAEALQEAISMKEAKRQKMADAAMAHIKKDFSLEGMCQKTLRLYEEVLSGTNAAVKNAVPKKKAAASKPTESKPVVKKKTPAKKTPAKKAVASNAGKKPAKKRAAARKKTSKATTAKKKSA